MDEKDDKFQYPTEWKDDSRMNALFAPFRPKELNPVAWESKMKFWTNLIHGYCTHHKLCVITIASLKCAFSRDGKMPACLDTVIDELKRNNTIVPAPLNNAESLLPEHLVPWLVKSLVKTPVQWAFGKIKSTIVSKAEDPQHVNYMHIQVVKQISDEFYSNLPIELKGRLLTLEDVQKIYPKVKNEELLTTILRPLVKDKKAAVAVLPELAVKFSKETAAGTTVTEVDKCVYKLEKNEKMLGDNVSQLEDTIDAAVAKARECVRNGRKPMVMCFHRNDPKALRWLRKKKETEKCLEKRINALDNLTALLDKIRNTESDQLILESYKLGIAALKTSLADSGLTADSAELTMDQLQEVLDESKEIETTISRPIDDYDIDLEAELEALQAEDGPSDHPGDTSGPSLNLSNLPVVQDDLEEKELEKRIKALAL